MPRVLGIDDFALRRGLVYATVLIDAETGRRVDVLQGRTADVVQDWLRAHPGVEVVCRDGSGAYGEAVRSALPGCVQVSDRWHLWHGLAEAAAKEVAGHSGCWADGAPLQEGKRAGITLERWQQVHDLRSKGAGYPLCSTDKQDLAAQRERLRELDVTEKRIYLDHGLIGTNRKRPGLDQALAAVREGDTLVIPKLDRLARSVPGARDIGDSLAQRGIKLFLGGQVYDPTDPMGKMFFNILATFAEFEVDLLRIRTREGMAVARAKGRLRGNQPKLSARQQTELRRMHATGDYSIADLTEL